MLHVWASFAFACFSLGAAHDASLPLNPALGVPGYPDCRRAQGDRTGASVAEAALELVCEQRVAHADSIRIACVGDSITAGVHSSGGVHPYPQQLQIMLEQAHGNGTHSTHSTV